MKRVDFPEARHELLRELPEVTDEIWRNIETFLSKKVDFRMFCYGEMVTFSFKELLIEISGRKLFASSSIQVKIQDHKED